MALLRHIKQASTWPDLRVLKLKKVHSTDSGVVKTDQESYKYLK